MGRGGAQRCSAALAGGLPEPPSPGGGKVGVGVGERG